MTAPTPAADLKTAICANDTVRLIREPNSWTATPETVEAEASSTGKTLSVPADNVTDGHRLDADDIAELERGGSVYRDSYHYKIFTPHRFAARCESQKESDPVNYRGPTPDAFDVRGRHRATHAPQRGSVWGPGGREAPAEWDDADDGTAAVATDGGTDERHDMAAWLNANGDMDSSADSGDGSAYIAEVVGEHRKYGVDREFVTDKLDDGARRLPSTAVGVGRVFEVQHCDADEERTYQVVTGVDRDGGQVVAIETERLAGTDEAIEALEWGDPERARLLDDIETQLEQLDTDELRTAATRLGVGTSNQDPADIARINPADIPGPAGEHIATMRKTFAAAYKRRFDAAPDAETRAAVIDAAALAEKRRND